VLKRCQFFCMQTAGFILSLFVSGCELEGLLLVCYVRQGDS
jgi:hypothetical protein